MKIFGVLMFILLVVASSVCADQNMYILKWSQTLDMPSISTDIYDVRPSLSADRARPVKFPMPDLRQCCTHLLLPEYSALNSNDHPDMFLSTQDLEMSNEININNELDRYTCHQINRNSTLLILYVATCYGEDIRGNYTEYVYQYVFYFYQPSTDSQDSFNSLNIFVHYPDVDVIALSIRHSEEIPFTTVAENISDLPGEVPHGNVSSHIFGLSSIPDPGTIMLLGFSGILLLYRKLRKQSHLTQKKNDPAFSSARGGRLENAGLLVPVVETEKSQRKAETGHSHMRSN